MYAGISAVVFTVLIGVVILFQLALAAGLPWGSYAMGGKFPGKYPPIMRFSCFFQVLLLALLALIVLSKSGFLLDTWHSFADSAIWFVVIFSIIAALLNSISRSKWEKRIWTPVSLLLVVTSLLVAFG